MVNKVRGSVIDLPQAASSPPVSGAYTAGQVIYNTAAGGNSGWRCTVSGNPGTWEAFGESLLDASATYDPASLASKASVSITIAVTGAAMGDYAVASFSNDLAGCTLTAYVSGAGTVTCLFVNSTSGTVNLSSGTLRVRVSKV